MPGTASQQLVVFRLGAEEYALPIGAVQEIVRFTEPRAVASADASIRGVIALRGKIVPVLDLAARMGLAGGGEPGRIVIVATGAGQAGLAVDAVEEVLAAAPEQIEPLPAGAGGGAIDAVARIGDRLVILLDPEGVLAPAGAERAAA